MPAQALFNLLDIHNFGESNSTNRNIAHQLLANLGKLEFIDIAEAAELCHVSPATMSRFVKGLGYESFSYFRQELSKNLTEYNYFRYVPYSAVLPGEDEFDAYLSQSGRLLDDLRENIDRAQVEALADAMHGYSKVHIHTLYYSHLTNWLQADLMLTGKKVRYLTNPDEQEQDAASIGANSFLLVVKHQIKESSHMDRIIKSVRDAGGGLGLILNTRHSPLIEQVDHALTFEGTQYFIDSQITDIYIALLSTIYRQKYHNRS